MDFRQNLRRREEKLNKIYDNLLKAMVYFDHYAALLSFKQQEVRLLLQKTTNSSYRHNDILRGNLEEKIESVKSVKSQKIKL